MVLCNLFIFDNTIELFQTQAKCVKSKKGAYIKGKKLSTDHEDEDKDDDSDVEEHKVNNKHNSGANNTKMQKLEAEVESTEESEVS